MASGQERTLHDRALQCWEEAKRALAAKLAGMTEAQEALGRGEVNNPAGRAWKEIFEQARPEAAALAARAKELKENLDLVALSAPTQTTPEAPVYRGQRPVGSDGAVLAPLTGEHLASLREALGPDADPRQVDDPFRRPVLSGRPRVLLNRLLRPAHHGGGGALLLNRLPQADLELLTGERTEQLMSPYIDRDGGEIVAEDLRNEVIRKIRDTTYIRGIARVIPTNAAVVAFPSARITLTLSPTRAGVGTGEAPTSLRNVFGKTQFTVSGQGKIVKVPIQLLEDATFDVISFITDEISQNDLETEEGYFLTGTGGGQPLGWLTAIANLEAAGFTGLRIPHGGAAGIAYGPDDIKRFPYKLRKGYRGSPSCAWMGHREFVEVVSIMRDASGGAGTGQYLFTMGLRAGDPETLVGLRLMESEFFPAPAAGANNPIAMLADWRQYWIIDRKSLELRFLGELYQETDEYGYKYTRRYDAAPVQSDAAKLLVAKAP